MGFQVVHLRRRYAGPEQRFLNYLDLGRRAGHGEAGAGPVLVDGRTQDDAPNGVTVGLSIAEPFQHDYPAAFAPDKAIGRSVKGFALAFGRQHPGLGAQLGQASVKYSLGSAHQHQVRLALPQRRNRLVYRHQGR